MASNHPSGSADEASLGKLFLSLQYASFQLIML